MATGSNAPVITNVLVAWPPPPSSARFGPSSPPSTARSPRFSLSAQLQSIQSLSPPSSHSPSFLGPGPLPLSGYASPRSEPSLAHFPASPSHSGSSTPVRSRSLKKESPTPRSSIPVPSARRDYPPPKAPLSPAQLGRIAKSFGIAVPTVADGGSGFTTPRTISNSPRPSSPTVNVPSGPSHVVAVVPPQCLLVPVIDADAGAEAERRKRWRRGRLIPLQPSLGAMLVSIAREFGLPSTLGIKVYLRGNDDDHRDGLNDSERDFGGPQVTHSTWATLFGHAARKSISPATTPMSTPKKRNPSAATFGAMMTTGPEPMEQPKLMSRSIDEGRSHSASSDSSISPPTPVSSSANPSLPLFGTIEFDIDPTEARWFDEWIKSGGPSRRFGQGSEIASIRELTLVERLKDPRPKFLRQMEEERKKAERRALEREAAEAREAARLAAENDEAIKRAAQQVQVEREEAEREAALEAQRLALAAERELECVEKERLEREASERQIPNGIGRGSPLRGNIQIEPVETVMSLVEEPSPISPNMLSPTSPNNDYRASGIVMADQLNSLEKSQLPHTLSTNASVVRELSPKELRFKNGPGRSRSGDTRSPTSPDRQSPIRLADLPARGSSRLPYLADASEEQRSTESTGSTPPITPGVRPEWPAISHKEHVARASGPPERRASRFRSKESTHRSTKYGGLSISSLNGPTSNGPPPRRPARPPTPDLTMPQSIAHVLPTEYVDALKSPTLPSGNVPVFGNMPSRPMSMSIKALRRQTSSKVVRPKDRAHAYAVANTRGEGPHPREASSASTLSYGSYGSGTMVDEQQYHQPFPTTEFGAPLDFDLQHGSSLPTRKDGSFTSRFFSFGNRKPRENDENRMTIMHISSPISTTVKHITPADLAASASAAGGAAAIFNDPGPTAVGPSGSTPPPHHLAASSPRGTGAALPPSVVGFSTPNPSASTLGPSDTHASDDIHRSQRQSLPTSPTSPRHVRRKPVPGMQGQRDSQNSVGSLPAP